MFRNTGYGPGGEYFDPPIHATMFHDGRYKLNVYHNLEIDGRRFEGELFDMQRNSKETRNLWDDPMHASSKANLIQRTLNWAIESDVRQWGLRGGEKFCQSVMTEYDREKQ